MLTKNSKHRIDANGSVQALVVDDDIIFAGLQGGKIVAWSLETYQLLTSIHAHEESVLSLTLSEDHSLLFSTGADSIINVWSTQTLQRLYSLYSHYEIGDIFCVAHSSKLQTLFCGCQNASIQWYQLTPDETKHSKSPTLSPGIRKHRFFDSLGPGGVATQSNGTSDVGDQTQKHGGKVLTIPKNCYLPYAHKSYIYSILIGRVTDRHDQEEEVLITGGGGGTIKIWAIDTFPNGRLQQLQKFQNSDMSVFSLAYDGSFLYAGLAHGTAHVYNLASQQLVQRLQVGDGDVSQIQVTNNAIICGTSLGLVKQFNNQFGEIDSWQANDGKILASTLTRRGNDLFLVTGGNDNAIALWELSKNKSTTRAGAHSNDELVNALREFIAFRTVAANPKFVTECHEAVTFLRKRCNAFGATTTLLSTEEGVNPILVAKFAASRDPQNSRTVLFYGHYDVVDAESVTSSSTTPWHTDPFTLKAMNGYLYGRGVTDDKGPILAAIYAVADLSQHGELSCNITFLLEGDEEAGSRGFRSTVQECRKDIGNVDFILLSNSYWLDDHIPCLTFGMRGVVHATITINSNRPDLHSGMDGKSVQHEPLKDMTALLGSLIGASGTEVMIPGFDDDVDELEEAELKAYGYITSQLLPGHPEIRNEKTFANSLMQRWRYPNLTIHRIEVPEAKTAVTISGSVQATLSIRIVPSQTAENVARTLTTFLEERFETLGSSNRLVVQITSKADPWLGNIRSELYESLKSAIIEIWTMESRRSFVSSDVIAADDAERNLGGPVHRRASSLTSHGTFTSDNTPRKPLFIREGGSIPAISFLENEFDAPAAMFPMGQASDNAHLNNEKIRVENLYNGREVLKRVFSKL